MNCLDRRRFILYASAGLIATGLSGAAWHLKKTKPMKSQTSINFMTTSHENSISKQTSETKIPTDDEKTKTPIEDDEPELYPDSSISS